MAHREACALMTYQATVCEINAGESAVPAKVSLNRSTGKTGSCTDRLTKM